MYIDNVEKKFGDFNYAKIRTSLHPDTVSEHLITQIPAIKNANQNQMKPKPLAGRRKSIFTIPLLRRKSIAEPPADNAMARRDSIAEPPVNDAMSRRKSIAETPANSGPRKIDLRRRTTYVPRETKKEIKPSVSRPNTPNSVGRNQKLEPKTPPSQTSALKRKLPQLEAENPAKRTPSSARDVLMRAIELKTQNLEKNGVILKKRTLNKTPTKIGGPQIQIALKAPTTGRSTAAPKTPILPSMPNVFDTDVNGSINGNVNGNHVPDPRLRPRNSSSVYQTRRQLSFTNNATPLNGLNGAKQPKSIRESMCQAFMMKMQTGLRELVSGLSEEQNITTNKPDAKMKMLLELEHAKQLELIEEKHKAKISSLEKTYRDNLANKNQAHKKQIEDLSKAQFDKVNVMKDKFQAEIKKKDNYVLQLQEELNAMRKKAAPKK